MKYLSLLNKFTLFFLAILFLSCADRKDIVYYQDIDNLKNLQENLNSYEIRIQPDDLLTINVSAEDPEIAAPFNLNPVSIVGDKQIATSGQLMNPTYLVDSSGNIEFPVLGKMKIGGMTRTEVLNLFQKKISYYITNPIITIRITNFKVSVQGEVGSPGIMNVLSDRITLIEALSQAGDLTIFGKRDNILIIRENNGVKSYHRVDITKSDFINSPFYYLVQNDVVYVEPNKNRINGAAANPSLGVVFSVTSILFTLITLIVTTTK